MYPPCTQRPCARVIRPLHVCRWASAAAAGQIRSTSPRVLARRLEAAASPRRSFLKGRPHVHRSTRRPSRSRRLLRRPPHSAVVLSPVGEVAAAVAEVAVASRVAVGHSRRRVAPSRGARPRASIRSRPAAATAPRASPPPRPSQQQQRQALPPPPLHLQVVVCTPLRRRCHRQRRRLALAVPRPPPPPPLVVAAAVAMARLP